MGKPFLPQTIPGKPRGHEGFYLPESIRHLGSMPLYRAVAWWGLLLGREFSRDDVSEAFRIDPRRASGILNDICNRHEEDDIIFDVHVLPVRGGRSQLVVHIRAVESDRQRMVIPGGKRVSCQHDRLMAHWLLSRPSGGDSARLAAWKAACPTPGGAMLTIVSDCQFTRLGLTRLLAHLQPTDMSIAQWLQNDAPTDGSILLAATRGMSAALVSVCRHARQSPALKLALLGSRGQTVLLNTLDLMPDWVVPGTRSAPALRAAISDWLRHPRDRRTQAPVERLSLRERQTLSATLAGIPVYTASARLGISPKTFYSQRRSALNRLEIRSIQELLANPVTGLPDPAAYYGSMLWPDMFPFFHLTPTAEGLDILLR